MGIDPSVLGPQARKFIAREKRRAAARGKPAESGLEARFGLYLRELGVPPARRNVRLPGMGKHEADFLWWRGTADEHEALAVFIDGAVHGLRGRIDDTARRDNLAALVLPPGYLSLRFCESQLQVGAAAVRAWIDGDDAEVVRLIQSKGANKVGTANNRNKRLRKGGRKVTTKWAVTEGALNYAADALSGIPPKWPPTKWALPLRESLLAYLARSEGLDETRKPPVETCEVCEKEPATLCVRFSNGESGVCAACWEESRRV